MSQLCRRLFAFPLVALALLAAGCGPSQLAHNALYPTRGKVTLHGEPAAFVIIHLEPTEPNKGVYAEGITKDDGTFQLRTYSNDEPDGAAPGQYHVVLEPFDGVRAVGTTLPAGVKPTPIPEAEWHTGVVVEVKAEDNDLDINVP
jgi:hypothetical protein